MAPNDPPDHPTTDEPELITRSVVDESGETKVTNRYRLLEQVGAGGMGEVYRAEQTDPMQRTVAIKVIKRGMDTKAVIARFEAERQALALMDHPNIAKVFEAGSTPRGRPYFAMEFVKGVPLTTFCDRQKLTTKERLELFMQLCDGVQHAHQKAIIHRDLKPSNVIVTLQDDRPVPKIIDFGVAKAMGQKLTEKTLYTALGDLIGTPAYMSPEQTRMTGEDTDTRTDVYSLGVILYELLTGALPFAPDELREAGFEGIIHMIREQDPPRPSTRVTAPGERSHEAALSRRTDPDRLRRLLCGDLDCITMRALEKDRARRYGSPSELAADIGRHLRSEPVVASPPSAGYRIRKFAERHRVVVAAGSVVVGALVIGVIGTTLALLRATRAEVEARIETATATQVSDFLVGLFEVSDPHKAKGDSITARELLDAGAARIREELAEQPLVQARLMGIMGNVYRELGLNEQARPLLEDALEKRRRLLGEDHLDVATSLVSLANLLRVVGDYAGARPLFERALEIRENALGPEHLDVASDLNNFAALLNEAGDYAGAQALFERALTIRETTLGPDSPDVAVSLNNLAAVLQDMGDLAGARPLLERALRIDEKVLGSDHPDLTYKLNNLAIVLARTGDNAAARPLFERSLRITEKAFGPDHANVARSLVNLAILLKNTGDYEGAKRLYGRALGIYEKALGSDHRYVGLTLHNLANLYRDAGDYTGAQSLYKRAIQVLEKALGAEHADVARSLNALANALRKSGDYAGAQSLFERALAIREKTLGPNSPAVASSMRGLAQVLYNTGDYASAQPLYERALEIHEKALGPEHRDVGEDLHDLANLFRDMGLYDRAVPLYERAQAIYEGKVGADHVDVAEVLEAHAQLRRQVGEESEAVELEARARAIRENPEEM